MKTPLLLFALSVGPSIAWLGFAPQRPEPQTGIAYVSSQRISNETADGRAGVAKVQGMQRERAEEVRKMQQALDATRAQLPLAPPDSRGRLQADEQRQRTELERAVVRAQADLQALQRQVNADVLAKVKGVVGGTLKDRKIQVVLNLETAVVWADPALDLTDAVIAAMNARPLEP